MKKKTLKNIKKKRNITIKNRGGNPYTNSSRSSSGSSTMTISPTETPSPKENLVLRLKVSDEIENVQNIPEQEILSNYEEYMLKNDIKNIRQKIDDNTFENIESNYQYFFMMNYTDIIENLFHEILFSKSGPRKLQEGGGAYCNGEILTTSPDDKDRKLDKNVFYLLSSFKNYVEIKHDFKNSTKDKQYKLNLEDEILEASRVILNIKNKKINSATDTISSAKKFYESSLDEYLNTSNPEKVYMMNVINYMDINCKLLNRLNLTKYVTDSDAKDRNYIDKKINQGEEDYITKFKSITSSDKPYPHDKQIFFSTIDNEPVKPIYSMEQTQFAFTDNNISHFILYQLVESISTTNEQGIKEVEQSNYEEFNNKMVNGKIQTIPSFMDPANRSSIFLNTDNLINPIGDITNAIRRRVQELQALNEAYSLPFIFVLMNSLNDFFSYYDSLLRVDNSYINMENQEIADFYNECINYIKTGERNDNNKQIQQNIMQKFPIKLGIGSEEGYIFINVRGLSDYKDNLILKYGDTTIKNISEFLNNKNLFSIIEKEQTITKFESKLSSDTFFQNKHTRIYNLAKAIYINIPNRGEIIENMKQQSLYKNMSGDLKLLSIIIVSLKAFGDACQVNYSRRMNKFLKEEIKFPLGVGIRSTDKNVFAESLLFNNPIWWANNGLEPHKKWINKLLDNELNETASVDVDKGNLVFITNVDKGDVRMYYDEIIKNMVRYKLYEEGLFDRSTPEIMNSIRNSINGDSDSDSDSDDEIQRNKTRKKGIKTGIITAKSEKNIVSNKENNVEILDVKMFDNLKQKMILTYGNRIENISIIENLFVSDNLRDENNQKNVLLEINVFTSTMNDFMRDYVYINPETNSNTLTDLINNYQLETKELIKKIVELFNGKKKEDTTKQTLLKNQPIEEEKLLKKISMIKNVKYSNKVNRLFSNMQNWVKVNLNQNNKMIFNNKKIQYKEKIVKFLEDIPVSFEKSFVGRSSGREKKPPERLDEQKPQFNFIVNKNWLETIKHLRKDNAIGNFKKYYDNLVDNKKAILNKDKDVVINELNELVLNISRGYYNSAIENVNFENLYMINDKILYIIDAMGSFDKNTNIQITEDVLENIVIALDEKELMNIENALNNLFRIDMCPKSCFPKKNKCTTNIEYINNKKEKDKTKENDNIKILLGKKEEIVNGKDNRMFLTLSERNILNDDYIKKLNIVINDISKLMSTEFGHKENIITNSELIKEKLEEGKSQVIMPEIDNINNDDETEMEIDNQPMQPQTPPVTPPFTPSAIPSTPVPPITPSVTPPVTPMQSLTSEPQLMEIENDTQPPPLQPLIQQPITRGMPPRTKRALKREYQQYQQQVSELNNSNSKKRRLKEGGTKKYKKISIKRKKRNANKTKKNRKHRKHRKN